MAISRYDARFIPKTEQTIAALRSRGQLVQAPHTPVETPYVPPDRTHVFHRCAIHLPVYSSLEDYEVSRVAAVVREAVAAAAAA